MQIEDRPIIAGFLAVLVVLIWLDYLYIAGFLVVLVWLIWFRPMKARFWRLANRHSDAAYDYLRADDCWIVSEYRFDWAKVRSDVSGPYYLSVPKLNGRVVTIYGTIGKMEDSQRRFIEMVG